MNNFEKLPGGSGEPGSGEQSEKIETEKVAEKTVPESLGADSTNLDTGSDSANQQKPELETQKPATKTSKTESKKKKRGSGKPANGQKTGAKVQAESEKAIKPTGAKPEVIEIPEDPNELAEQFKKLVEENRLLKLENKRLDVEVVDLRNDMTDLRKKLENLEEVLLSRSSLEKGKVNTKKVEQIIEQQRKRDKRLDERQRAKDLARETKKKRPAINNKIGTYVRNALLVGGVIAIVLFADGHQTEEGKRIMGDSHRSTAPKTGEVRSFSKQSDGSDKNITQFLGQKVFTASTESQGKKSIIMPDVKEAQNKISIMYGNEETQKTIAETGIQKSNEKPTDTIVDMRILDKLVRLKINTHKKTITEVKTNPSKSISPRPRKELKEQPSLGTEFHAKFSKIQVTATEKDPDGKSKFIPDVNRISDLVNASNAFEKLSLDEQTRVVNHIKGSTEDRTTHKTKGSISMPYGAGGYGALGVEVYKDANYNESPDDGIRVLTNWMDTRAQKIMKSFNSSNPDTLKIILFDLNKLGSESVKNIGDYIKQHGENYKSLSDRLESGNSIKQIIQQRIDKLETVKADQIALADAREAVTNA